jgi:hypothetical protein
MLKLIIKKVQQSYRVRMFVKMPFEDQQLRSFFLIFLQFFEEEPSTPGKTYLL